MSLIRDWSTTPANNELTIPYGAPITWYPSEVSSVVRQHMADHRTQWEDAEWFNWGHEATQASGTTFTVATNLTSVYVVGRRLKIADTATLLGTITASAYVAPNTTVTVQLDSGSLTSAMNGQNVFVSIYNPANRSIIAEGAGFLKMYLAPSLPDNTLLANGAAISRTVYSRLFTAIGTTWGAGDGSTTFNVPDCRGEFPRFFDAGRGVDAGRVFAVFQDQAYLSHTHGLSFPPAGAYHSAEAGSIQVAGGPNAISQARGFPAATAASGGTETRPRNITVYPVVTI